MSEDRLNVQAARAVSDEIPIRECLYLVSKGVPFDVAFSLDATIRLAWCVIFGELDGGVFDWSRLAWEKRDS